MTRVTLQILQNYSDERNPCIIISHGKHKFLFNMGEPFLRYYKQHNVKLVTNMNIFFTRNTFDCMNGIQNLITSMYGSDASFGTKIFGPKNLVKIFDKFRCPYTRFVSYSFYDLSTNEKIVGVNDITASRKLKYGKPQEFNQHYYVEKWNEFIKQNLNEKLITDPASIVDAHNRVIKGQEQITLDYIAFDDQKCLAYQINLPPVKGKLDKEKLDKFKIPKNQMKNLMQNGEVQLETGETVKLDDVKSEDKRGNSVLLFDCQKESILDEAISNNKILYAPSQDNQLILVVHMAPQEVVSLPKYKEFLSKFEANVQHIFISPGFQEVIQDNHYDIINVPYRHQKVVSKLYEDFSEHFLNISTVQSQFIKQQDNKQDNQLLTLNQLFPDIKNLQLSKRNFEFTVSGSNNDYIPLDAVVSNELNKTIVYNQNYLNLVNELKQNSLNAQQNMEAQKKQIDDKRFDPEIILLGTTCALPSKYRNNSSILVKNEKNDTSIMLDAGDGTYFQLLGIYGNKKIDEELLKIKIILISHFHADHYMGFQEVIWRRQEVQRKRGIKYSDDPIYIVLPWDMATWVDALRHMEGDILFNEVYIQSYNNDDFSEYATHGFKKLEFDCQKAQYNTYEEDKAIIRNKRIGEILTSNAERLNQNIEGLKLKLKEVGYSSLKMIPVIHCQQAYGYVLEADDPYQTKISYTGDTRPCKKFIEAANNSSLIIHESTYQHDEVDLAEKALHSTVTEAIDVALQSLSKNILLTHISKRHKLLKIHEEGQTKEFIDFAQNNTVMAYDFLRFRLSNFYELVPITKAVGYIYKKN
ncbi:metallo-beta-lactamase domain protein (macronuclear) [Tetrahymena thermophila SB210]|uniref:ribonuclease Z n=1 Tax=Tetrahymena thermophila (strain SB210) TaxID=312017 RepID=I7M3B6_TETTS|nr:metallo-beta-lactamase domain protein [Tetrahymena thermophila SB210]EAS02834.1 metallo-beta-lactamase domain protein [Tetrahymena thermophila SB210]|eukprot:XP_001023079.1 metallo-beta-lactamase domain protein [Tetrahymena thermophila SB210]